MCGASYAALPFDGLVCAASADIAYKRKPVWQSNDT